MKKIYFILLFLLETLFVFSQAPTNNNCNNATVLTVGTNSTQNVVTGTNVNATSSGELPNPSCGTYGGNDVWYTVQVPATGVLTVETQDAGSNIDTAIEIYTGTCGNLTAIACNDDINWPSNPFSRINLTGLPNTTVYVRVWAWNNASTGNFNIVAYDVSPPVPPNNNCTSATNLTVGNTNTQNVVTGTTINATSSGELPAPNCANYLGNDVWYTALVPASGILNIETQDAGSNIDTGLAVYTGTCGALTLVACDDDSGPGLYSTLNLTGLPNTTVYIRVWAYNNASSGAFNIVAYTPLCPFTTRWNGSSWNNGLPNSFTSAVLNNNYDTAINGSFESCDCSINNNRTLTISANNYITVHNDLTVNGTLDVAHQGSLLMTNDNAVISVTGTVNVHKTSTALHNFRDFTYWSSPVNTTITQVFGAGLGDGSVDSNRVFEFNTANNSWNIASGTMVKAKGYISEAPRTTPAGGTHSVTFTGAPNNGVVDINVIGNDKFNLIGNPYPSAINIDDFIVSNPIIDGTIWLWTHNTAISNGTTGDFIANDYATYNLTGGTVTASSAPSNPGGVPPTNNIASGQGFFVKATSSGTLSFNNSMRLQGQNTQFFRASNTKKSITQEKDRIWLHIESATGGAFNQLLIGFFDAATDGVDRGFDGAKVGAAWISFYSTIDSTKYAIQGLGSFSADKKVQLGFDTYIPNQMTYKISIDKMEGALKENDIYLVDHELNITHDLKLADYEFSVNGAGNFLNRFTLRFSKTSKEETPTQEETSTDFVVMNQENTLLLRAGSVMTTLKIYDLTGRLLIDKNPQKKEFALKTQSIRKGTVLVVNAVLENNQSVSKKVLLY